MTANDMLMPEASTLASASEASNFPHLLDEVKAVAERSASERCAYIDEDRWLPYRRANEILAAMEDLLTRPRINRPPNLMVVGRSGNGKSHVMDHFARLHPGQKNLEGPNIIAPVMLIETPPTANATDLYDTILGMLNRAVPRATRGNERRDAAKDILGIVKTKVLLVDEINHLLSGSPKRQQDFLFALKYLSNELRMSIVISGTPESLQLIRLSDQIENRFQLEPLPVWPLNDELRVLLANFEQALPLRKKSKLSGKAMASLIHSIGGDTIGSIASLLNKAAKMAITSGEEQITEEILRACAPMSKQEKLQIRRNL